MLREEAIEKWVIPALKRTWNEKRCNEVLEALEQEPCEELDFVQPHKKVPVNLELCTDSISRQAAIDLADELKDDLPDDVRLSDMVMSHNEGILEYQTKLSLLPSVQPECTEEYCPVVFQQMQEECEDAISRRDMALNIVIFYNKATGKKKTLDFLCKCVEGLPSVQPKTGWIPVSERLPEKNGQYLVTTASVCGALITIRSYAKKFSRIDPYDFRSAKGGGWYDYDSEFGYWQDTEVKAWIPLPQPFEGNTK